MKKNIYDTWDAIEADGHRVYTGSIDFAGFDPESDKGQNGWSFEVASIIDADGEQAGTVVIDYTENPGKMTAYIFEGAGSDDEARPFARKLIEPYKGQEGFSCTWYFEDDEES